MQYWFQEYNSVIHHLHTTPGAHHKRPPYTHYPSSPSPTHLPPSLSICSLSLQVSYGLFSSLLFSPHLFICSSVLFLKFHIWVKSYGICLLWLTYLGKAHFNPPSSLSGPWNLFSSISPYYIAIQSLPLHILNCFPNNLKREPEVPKAVIRNWPAYTLVLGQFLDPVNFLPISVLLSVHLHTNSGSLVFLLVLLAFDDWFSIIVFLLNGAFLFS